MSERGKQTIISFVVGLLIVEIPVLVTWLTAIPQPDEKILFAGLLGGLLGALKRYAETSASAVSTLNAEVYANVAARDSLTRPGGGASCL